MGRGGALAVRHAILHALANVCAGGGDGRGDAAAIQWVLTQAGAKEALLEIAAMAACADAQSAALALQVRCQA